MYTYNNKILKTSNITKKIKINHVNMQILWRWTNGHLKESAINCLLQYSCCGGIAFIRLKGAKKFEKKKKKNVLQWKCGRPKIFLTWCVLSSRTFVSKIWNHLKTSFWKISRIYSITSFIRFNKEFVKFLTIHQN